MTVKNEAANIGACLAPIYDLFAEIHIVDTGSTDDTVAVLRDQFGVEASHGKLSAQRCYSLSDLRNKGFEQLRTPWILCLDADERIQRDALSRMMESIGQTTAQGFFTPWRTHINGLIIEDYKLSFFRRGFHKLGLVHDNVQASFRQQGVPAEWYGDLVIEHFPAHHREREKHEYYEQRLRCAIDKEPTWMRYYWFLGYRHFRQGDFYTARKNLQLCFDSRSDFFPVETLNSAMVLASIHTLNRDYAAAERVIRQALEFYLEKQNDFEVRVNSGLGQWLTTSLEQVQNKDTLTPPLFAY